MTDLTNLTQPPAIHAEIAIEEMELAQLGEFLRSTYTRNNKDRWMLGRAFEHSWALFVIRRKSKEDWIAWCKQQCPGISQATIYRHRALFGRTSRRRTASQARRASG